MDHEKRRKKIEADSHERRREVEAERKAKQMKQEVTIIINNHDAEEDVGIDIVVDTEKTEIHDVRNQIAKFLESVDGVEVETSFN